VCIRLGTPLTPDVRTNVINYTYLSFCPQCVEYSQWSFKSCTTWYLAISRCSIRAWSSQRSSLKMPFSKFCSRRSLSQTSEYWSWSWSWCLESWSLRLSLGHLSFGLDLWVAKASSVESEHLNSRGRGRRQQQAVLATVRCSRVLWDRCADAGRACLPSGTATAPTRRFPELLQYTSIVDQWPLGPRSSF